MSFYNDGFYVELDYSYNLKDEKREPNSLNWDSFLSNKNRFYIKHHFKQLDLTGYKTHALPPPSKIILKPGILFIDLPKDKMDQEFEIQDEYTLNEFIRAFNL